MMNHAELVIKNQKRISLIFLVCSIFEIQTNKKYVAEAVTIDSKNECQTVNAVESL